MKKLTFIVLVWNEVKTIEKAIKDVQKIKYSNKEIIIIDNNSTDGTVEVLNKIKGIKVIYQKKNLGAGRSIVTGIKKAKGEYVFIQFSDLEYDHNRSIDMLNYAVEKDLDIVLGSRLKNRKSIYKLLIKKPAYLATLLTTFLINIFYKKNFTDIIGAKLYKTKTVKKIPVSSFHMGFDFEFISRSCKRKLKFGEISIKYKPRTIAQGKKIRYYHMFVALYQIFKVKIFE